MTPPRPPRLARLLLRALVPSDLRDDFEGDLAERFVAQAREDPAKARRRYWRDVLSPSLLRLRREARGLPLVPGSSPRSARGDGLLRAVAGDLRYAVRWLRKSPGFAAVAVLSLALGIGPNTAIFSLVDLALFRDWGVDDPSRIVDVYSRSSSGSHYFVDYATYERVSEGTSGVFEAVTAHSFFAGRFEAGGGGSEPVLGEMVTGSYFEVMGVDAALGRTFLPEEHATPGTHPVLVVSRRFWRDRYDADPGLVGRAIRLNGRPYTVIGIAPAEFAGRMPPGIGSDFWVPISMYPHLAPGKLGFGDLTISGRLAEGRSFAEGAAAVEAVARAFNEQRLAENPDARGGMELAPVLLADVRIHPDFDGVASGMAALLLAAVGLVLLVACVNLAGFLLSRAVDRRREMAVRVAMGAGRGAIVRQLLVESLLLAGLGAAVGLVLGQAAARALAGIELPVPYPMEPEIRLDTRLLLFTAGTAVVAAVLFGLTPSLDATRTSTAATLRDEAGSSAGRRKVGARGLLVTGQLALSTVLLFGAALFVRSLVAAGDVDLGFSTRAASVVHVDPDPAEYDRGRVLALAGEMLASLRASPATTDVALTGRMPLALGNILYGFSTPGVEPPPDQNLHVLEYAPVTDGYFETMGIDLVEGRTFEAADGVEAATVGVLSRSAADRFWPGERAVGRVLHGGGDPENALTVVGVVDDVKIWSLSEPARPYLYRPFAQAEGWAGFYVVARGPAPPAELASLSAAEARAIDPEIFLTDVGTMDDHLDYAYFLPRMAALLISLVGALALALACIGLYGMVSYGVSRRRREIGIRMALGAERRGVLALVLGGGLKFFAVGGALGVAGSLLLARLAGIEQFLYGGGDLDLLAVLAAPTILGLVATAATWLPARRAGSVDPVQALKAD